MRETALQTPRSVKKEGMRWSSSRGRYPSADHGEGHGETDCHPATCMGARWSRYPACGGPHAAARGHALKEAMESMERSPCQSRLILKDCSLREQSHAGAREILGDGSVAEGNSYGLRLMPIPPVLLGAGGR